MKTMKTKKIAILIIITGGFLTLLGSSMIIMHWPMARFIHYGGMVLLVLGLVLFVK